MAKKSTYLSRRAARQSYKHVQAADDHLAKALAILGEAGAEGIMQMEILQLRGSVAAARLITERARGTAADLGYSDDWAK